MIRDSFGRVYDKFKFQFYRRIFEHVQERDGSLSAMEFFSLEIIKALGNPTISEFADFLNISQSNATYKVNSLQKKGYIEKENSSTDRREYHLVLSEKYYKYMSLFSVYEDVVMGRIEARFSEEDVKKFDEMLTVISDELMPECDKK